MARKQVAARMSGDHYQALFFWKLAAALLIDDSGVERVVLEHDEASGVDDIAVYYSGDRLAERDKQLKAEFYQIKYHVDARGSYCSDNIIDPKFIGTKTSLLQRFYAAYEELKEKFQHFNLLFASNWNWHPDDLLAKKIREDDGSLPDSFFEEGSGSKLGKIRLKWKEHLGIDDHEFEQFAKRLRFQFNHFGRLDFQEFVSNYLQLAGLTRKPFDKEGDIYISLAQSFITDSQNDFTRKSFFEMCMREGLLDESKLAASMTARQRSIGIRSFMRFAEQLEQEVSDILCLTKFFDGRQLKKCFTWKSEICKELEGFLQDRVLLAKLQQGDSRLFLDCHMSIAFYAGYLLDLKSGVRLSPVQKGSSGRSTWRINDEASVEGEWDMIQEDTEYCVEDVAVCLSVSRNIMDDVRDYVEESGIKVKKIYNFTPMGGAGSRSLLGADNAWSLADKLSNRLRKLREGKRGAVVHLFPAVPNAFLFFLGRHGKMLGAVQIYEFSPDCVGNLTYTPSVRVN